MHHQLVAIVIHLHEQLMMLIRFFEYIHVDYTLCLLLHLFHSTARMRAFVCTCEAYHPSLLMTYVYRDPPITIEWAGLKMRPRKIQNEDGG